MSIGIRSVKVQPLNGHVRRLLFMLASALLVAMGVVAWNASSPEPTGTAGRITPDSVELVQGASGPSWSVSYAAAADSFAAAQFLVNWDSVPPVVEAIDATTGTVIARLQVAYNPMVIRRPSAGELLVADMPEAPSASTVRLAPRLLAFDLTNVLQLKYEVSLPDRIPYSVYAPGLGLSTDERYLFYPKRTYREELPACRGGGDAAVCDKHAVGIIDLHNPAAPQAVVELPQGCGWALYSPVDATSVSATCPESGEVHIIQAGQPAQRRPLAAFSGRPSESAPELRKTAARGRISLTAADGSTGTLFVDGTFVRIDPQTRRETVVRAVPAGKRLAADVIEMSPARVLVPYKTSYADPAIEGVAVFDPVRLQVERAVPLADAESLVRLDDRSILMLTTTGRLLRVDVTSGQATTLSAAAGNGRAKVLVP